MRGQMTKGEIFSGLAIAAIVIGILWTLLSQQADCSDAGGKFVRGVFWFECIR